MTWIQQLKTLSSSQASTLSAIMSLSPCSKMILRGTRQPPRSSHSLGWIRPRKKLVISGKAWIARTRTNSHNRPIMCPSTCNTSCKTWPSISRTSLRWADAWKSRSHSTLILTLRCLDFLFKMKVTVNQLWNWRLSNWWNSSTKTQQSSMFATRLRKCFCTTQTQYSLIHPLALLERTVLTD